MERKIINCPHCGKIISSYVLNGDAVQNVSVCPQCGSRRNFKDGIRYTNNGEKQRYLCRDCSYRFS